MTINDLLAAHSRIGVDSGVFIYLLEGTAREADLAGSLVDAISAGSASATLAMLGLAEILTGPARGQDIALAERYADELLSLDGLLLPEMDSKLALEAALLRGSAPQLTLRDAVHLASARLQRATVFVTNDRRLRPITGLEIAYLDRLKRS
jgi:predicted nucleic acid-binding protein